jgi:hypothetical protein
MHTYRMFSGIFRLGARHVGAEMPASGENTVVLRTKQGYPQGLG